MKDILAKLVALPTTSDNPQANHQAIGYIDRSLSQRGLFVKRHEWGSHESLVATTRPTKTPKIMLAGHIDVVPGPQHMYQLTEKGDKLYGRGVQDMKFAIAAFLQLVDDIQDDLDKYDFGIMITSDEETSGQYGTKKLLEVGYRPQICVLPDGAENWALEQSCKGVMWVVATASGTAAHGSRPWEGESAIEKMLSFLHDVRHDLFSNQGPDTNTCNVSIIKGGNTFNQISDSCQVDIDIRFTSREEQDKIVSHIAELAKTHQVNYELRLNDAAVNIDLADPLVAAYIRSFEKIIGLPLKTMRSHGSSDARYFAGYDIPTLVMYPPSGGYHSDCEWIDTKAFYQFRDLLQDYLDQNAKTPESSQLRQTAKCR
jgi:succinyl-diaminopimelate desuccinylase